MGIDAVGHGIQGAVRFLVTEIDVQKNDSVIFNQIAIVGDANPAFPVHLPVDRVPVQKRCEILQLRGGFGKDTGCSSFWGHVLRLKRNFVFQNTCGYKGISPGQIVHGEGARVEKIGGQEETEKGNEQDIFVFGILQFCKLQESSLPFQYGVGGKRKPVEWAT